MISEKLKSIGKSRASLNEPFNIFVEKCMSDLAKIIIDNFIDVGLEKEKLFEHWLKQRWRYKYFNQWLKSYLFIFYYAVAYPNEPIDRNAQEDIEQLVFLQGLDILVSNDQKFIKKAFMEIYGNSDKKFLSLDDFLILVKVNSGSEFLGLDHSISLNTSKSSHPSERKIGESPRYC